VSDPLGICVHDALSAEYELLVLPRVDRVRSPTNGRLDGQGRAQLQASRHTTLQVDSLRPYRPGASASRIHWPTVARTGALMERGVAAETSPGVLVMLDADQPTSEEALDQALRATASLCVHLAQRGGCGLLLPGDAQPCVIGPDLRCWPALHSRLALVQAGTRVHRGSRPRRSAELFYVTASAAGHPAMSGQFYRVSPSPLVGLGVAFTVAGCSGQIVNRQPPGWSG
jgi:uncharacterized protein (DUF58 family)